MTESSPNKREMDNWIIRIVDKGYKTARDIYIYRRVFGGTEVLSNDGIATTTTTIIADGNPTPAKPFMSLEPEQLQALADELAQVGYKPQKGLLEGKLEAQSEHLKDLRKLLKL